MAARRCPWLATRCGRRAFRRLPGRNQKGRARREARRTAARRSLGGRFQQDQLWPPASLSAGLGARLRHGLPLPRHGHRLFDGLQERLPGSRGYRNPARELPARGTGLRAQSAFEPRPSAHHLGARRWPRRVAAARERAQQMAPGRELDGSGQEPFLAGDAHADDLPGRTLNLLRR